MPGSGRLLTPREAGDMFRVGAVAVIAWAKAGKLTTIRTPGGHRRFRESEALALLQGTVEGRDAA